MPRLEEIERKQTNSMPNRIPFLRQNLRIAPIQKLTLTPALLQKIELLALSRLELNDLVATELLQNPVLEDVTEHPETVSLSEFSAPAPLPENDGRPDDSFEQIDYDSFFTDYLDPGFRTNEREECERPQFDTFTVKPVSLYDHLTWQLNLEELPPPVHRAAVQIIGNLDEGGWLTAAPEEIAHLAECTADEAGEALTVVQNFDPPGIGARDLRECLLIQLRQADEEGSLAYVVLERHAGLLEEGAIDEIAGLEGVPRGEVEEAIASIRRLNPHPGLQYQTDSTLYIQPEVTIQKVGNKYVILLNEDGMPRLRINAYYRKVLEEGRTRGNDRKFLKEKFKNALDLIRNLDHRKRTIYRVCEIIVERQKDFLDNGFSFLRPMQLRDVAEELNLHTSTISRAVTKKWVNCPQGILELRQFFSLGFKTDSGEDLSVHNLKRKIQDLIGGEDRSSPLSDDEITLRLNRQGVEIKRRTVAKYREEMNIPNSRARRRNGPADHGEAVATKAPRPGMQRNGGGSPESFPMEDQ